MNSVLNKVFSTSTKNVTPKYPPIEMVNLPTVPTDQFAHYLNRKPQTCRAWACLENGPIRPLRINGRLAWPVAEIRILLGLNK